MSVTTETLYPTVNSAWRLDINTGTTELPEWTQVRGMSNFVPGMTPTTQDATDYDAEGWGSDATTMRKWSNTLTVLRKRAVTDDSEDPGQAALRAAADAGDEVVHVRWYDRTASTAESYEGDALVQWSPQGGDAAGLQAVNVTLLGQGARREVAHPDAGV